VCSRSRSTAEKSKDRRKEEGAKEGAQERAREAGVKILLIPTIAEKKADGTYREAASPEWTAPQARCSLQPTGKRTWSNEDEVRKTEGKERCCTA
jgi:hypothetical protein